MKKNRRKDYIKAKNIKNNNIAKGTYRGMRLSQDQADKIIKMSKK